MSKWLVTGGAGFVGQNLVKLLHYDGFTVVSLDIRERPRSQSFPSQVDHIEANYGDKLVLQELLKGFHGVLHLGALKNPSESIANESLYMKNNYVDSQTLFQTARECGVDKFIFASSAAVYGYSKNEPVREEDRLSPTTPYGRLKMEFEDYLIANAQGDCAFTSLRLFNVAGVGVPGAVDTSTFSLIPQVARKVRGSEPVIIYGDRYETADGTAMRDYVHVTDIAQSFVNAAKKLEEGKSLSPAINIATGVGATVQEVVDTLAAVSGQEIKTVIEPERPGDIGISIGDNSKAREELGWMPSHSLREIVQSAWQA